MNVPFGVVWKDASEKGDFLDQREKPSTGVEESREGFKLLYGLDHDASEKMEARAWQELGASQRELT